MTTMKQWIKRTGVAMTRALGPRLGEGRLHHWVCDGLSPYLLDEQVLPRELVPRRLNRFGVHVLCNPYVYTHRAPYWCGRLFEQDLERYLLRSLKPGDTFIDVGCNVGQVTLAAAKRVGPSGRVLAFDANPRLAALTAAQARRERLAQVTVHPFGLGRQTGEFTLRFDPEHDGGGTLRRIESDKTIEPELFTGDVRCQIRRGDDVIDPAMLPGRLCLKVDVEGHEPDVLTGMPRLLRRVGHAVLEVSPEWIGGSRGVDALFAVLRQAGLTPCGLNQDGSIGRDLQTDDIHDQVNVLFRRQ